MENYVDKTILLNAFNDNMSINDIANKFNLTWSFVYQQVCNTFKKSISDLSDEEINDICTLYKNGLSMPKIAEKYKIYHKAISVLLKNNNISKNKDIHRKYKLNESYFDNIDTPNKAYIFGLLYADGNNSMDKSTVRISLQESDVDLLEKVRHELESENPLKYIDYSNRIYGNGYVSKNMYQLEFYSSHMCSSLCDHGLIPNKSLKIDFPKDIDKSLYSHFIRGYFDGNGSFCHRVLENGSCRDVVTITSTNLFCTKTLDIIRSQTSIFGGNVYDASCHNGITKVISISGINQCKKFHEYIYENADIYLDRKYQHYKNTIG